MSVYQIAEVAERSGFTPATLRYYEDIGLMPAAERSGCCRFFGFSIVIDDRGVALEVHAPDTAADLVTTLFGAPG